MAVCDFVPAKKRTVLYEKKIEDYITHLDGGKQTYISTIFNDFSISPKIGILYPFPVLHDEIESETAGLAFWGWRQR